MFILLYYTLYLLIFQLKIYTAREKPLNFETSCDMIGYILPNTSVTISDNIPLNNDVTFINASTFFLWLLYVISVILSQLLYNQHENTKQWIENFKEKNCDLIVGMKYSATTITVFESVAKIISCSMWTLYINNWKVALPAVWLPLIFIFLIYISDIIIHNIIVDKTINRKYQCTLLGLYTGIYILAFISYSVIFFRRSYSHLLTQIK